MKTGVNVYFKCLLTLLFAIGWPSVSFAQQRSTGTLSGIVSNAATSNNLTGATVELPELGRQAQTDDSGRYEINHLPPGSYKVVVSYAGLDSMEGRVEVGAGGQVAQNFELTSKVYQMDAFTISAEREGNAASITKQRNANNVVNVVAIDAYGNVAEGNLGNFMQRLPGVATNNEVGDITGIIVRGAPPSWNAVNIDGTRASSANASSNIGAMGRGTVIDQIPPEFIKEIELTKAPTPDMPADSIGGNANLVTKSALDIKGNRLSYRASGTLNTYRDDGRTISPSGSVTYLGKLGSKQRLGIALSASYIESFNTRDRVQLTRNTEQGFTNQARTLDDSITRIRSGVGLKLDYAVSDSTRLAFGAQYSYFEFDQLRTDWNITAVARVADYSLVSRAAIEGGAVPRAPGNLAAGVAPGATVEFSELLNANFVNTQGREYRESYSYKFSLGGESKFEGDQTLKFSASFSPSEYDFKYGSMVVNRNGGIGLSVDSRANIERPIYSSTFGPVIGTGAGMTNVTSSLLQSNQRYSEEEMSNLHMDYTKKFSQISLRPELKAGLDWRRQYRSFDTFFPRWNYVGTGGASARDMSAYVRSEPGYGVFNNLYPQRVKLDYEKFLAAFVSNPSLFTPQGVTVSQGTIYNNATEDVSSAYLRELLNLATN